MTSWQRNDAANRAAGGLSYLPNRVQKVVLHPFHLIQRLFEFPLVELPALGRQFLYGQAAGACSLGQRLVHAREGLGQRQFYVLARSNVVNTPRAGMSDTIDENWADIDHKKADRIYAMSAGYDPTASGGSNLGPTSAKYVNGTTKKDESMPEFRACKKNQPIATTATSISLSVTVTGGSVIAAGNVNTVQQGSGGSFTTVTSAVLGTGSVATGGSGTPLDFTVQYADAIIAALSA
jgi:K+-transporting ATPase c subunit